MSNNIEIYKQSGLPKHPVLIEYEAMEARLNTSKHSIEAAREDENDRGLASISDINKSPVEAHYEPVRDDSVVSGDDLLETQYDIIDNMLKGHNIDLSTGEILDISKIDDIVVGCPKMDRIRDITTTLEDLTPAHTLDEAIKIMDDKGRNNADKNIKGKLHIDNGLVEDLIHNGYIKKKAFKRAKLLAKFISFRNKGWASSEELAEALDVRVDNLRRTLAPLEGLVDVKTNRYNLITTFTLTFHPVLFWRGSKQTQKDILNAGYWK